MSEHTHRGASPDGPFHVPPDRRINELVEELRNNHTSPLLGFARDPNRTAGAHLQALSGQGHITIGTVIHAIPTKNWYKVQLADGGGTIGACKLSDCSLVPLGPRSVELIAPNSAVLVFLPRGGLFAYILGIAPQPIMSGAPRSSDSIVQGSNAGYNREEAHQYPETGTDQSGGVQDFSNSRPTDETGLIRGWVSPTGISLTVDDFLLQARVSEMCGLWMSWYDDWLRLAGKQLLVESASHEVAAGDDEGEAYYQRGIAMYPWEAVGCYDRDSAFAGTATGDENATVDMLSGKKDVQPFYRYMEYGGYLGQGHFRIVSAPPKQTGVRAFSDTDVDEGLFRESISADGDYSLVSAKRIHIGKRGKVISPRRRYPHDSGTGDDAASENYKFSGVFGGDEAHEIGDLPATGEYVGLRKIAAVSDLVSYIVNWKALHPFHYHRQDFNTPQESEQTQTFERVQEELDFSELETQNWLSDPEAKTLHIDDRYGDVNYFERESFIILEDDGSVHIGSGCGSEIVLGQGGVRVTTPGAIMLLPGTDLLAAADQMCFRTKGSIDHSAGKDYRVKAENNMQMLAANGGEGAMLFESKSSGDLQEYSGVFGEDVRGNGIVFRSQAAFGVVADEVYLRADRNVVIDAAKGQGNVGIVGDTLRVSAATSVQFNIGQTDQNSDVATVYEFAEAQVVLDAQLLLGGKLIGYKNSGIVLDGDILAKGSVQVNGSVATTDGGTLGKVDSSLDTAIDQTTSEAVETVDEAKTDGKDAYDTDVVSAYYGDGKLGNDDLLKALHFSFRDPPTGDQYHVENLIWPESRWQQMVRLGAATGGNAWDEKPVVCQGEETYPYPGKRKWLEEAIFAQIDALSLFDSAAGYSVDRGETYAQAALPEFSKVTMASGFKLNR